MSILKQIVLGIYEGLWFVIYMLAILAGITLAIIFLLIDKVTGSDKLYVKFTNWIDKI